MVFSGYHKHGLVTRIATEDFALGACQAVVIAIWRRRTHLDAIGILRDYILERAKLHSRIHLLQIIEDDATAPNPLARKALAQVHREHASLIRRSAVVYAKPGFAGATARAIITGVAMINPPKFEHEIFASISSALQWLHSGASAEKAVETLTTLTHAVGQLQGLEEYSPSHSDTQKA